MQELNKARNSEKERGRRDQERQHVRKSAKE